MVRFTALKRILVVVYLNLVEKRRLGLIFREFLASRKGFQAAKTSRQQF